MTEADVGPHAMACGALWPERVIAVVSMSAPAPLDAEGLDWFAGWSRSGVAEQRAAGAGRAAPVLILHGDQDRMVPSAHGKWLAAHCPAAELRLAPDAGHITVLDSAPAALEWLRDQASRDQAAR
ncbi:MAG: alpha/beta fold hydrolase [Streptosporangiaceae bacterium]